MFYLRSLESRKKRKAAALPSCVIRPGQTHNAAAAYFAAASKLETRLTAVLLAVQALL